MQFHCDQNMLNGLIMLRKCVSGENPKDEIQEGREVDEENGNR